MLRLTILIAFAIFISFSAFAVEGVELTLKGGFTVPNDELGKVYNSNEQSINNNLVNFKDAEAVTGYTLGVKAAVPLNEYISSYAHFGIHQTGETEYKLYEGIDGSDEIGTVAASQLVIPVGVGGEIHFLKISMADVYATGQFNFNFLTSDVEIVASQLGDTKDDPTDVRMGFGLGVGSNFDLGLIKVNTELLYHSLNPILAESTEDSKSLVSFTVGLVF